MNYLQLGETALVVPNLWDKDWDSAIDEAEGGDRELLRTQQMLASLLKPLDGAFNTPVNVSWLILWSRAFSSADGMRAGLAWDSYYSVQILSRAILELFAHVTALANAAPESTHRVAGVTSPRSSTRDRLHAYVAWAMKHDVKYYRTFRQPDLLRAVYEPHTARRLIERLGAERSRWESFAGEIEEVSDQEAEFDMRKAGSSAAKLQGRLEFWLTHPDLEPWSRLLDTRRRGCSLFELFEDSQRSFRDRLRGVGQEFMYLGYMRSSGVLHGSTMTEFAYLGGSAFTPSFAALKGSCEESAARNGEVLRLLALALAVIRDSSCDLAS